ITDALLGALALPDIGTFFPDTDPKYQGADSTLFLKDACRRMKQLGYRLLNLDSILVCDRPNISPYAPKIRANIARILKVSIDAVGLKAKTCEGTRIAVPGRSIAAFALVILYRAKR
ncbi:MAG: 2-C-methyl-D-erythritol 2,4-cyclodiphosphate synthase, partial [candidate division WOR-3 bacterium]